MCHYLRYWVIFWGTIEALCEFKWIKCTWKVVWASDEPFNFGLLITFIWPLQCPQQSYWYWSNESATIFLCILHWFCTSDTLVAEAVAAVAVPSGSLGVSKHYHIWPTCQGMTWQYTNTPFSSSRSMLRLDWTTALQICLHQIYDVIGAHHHGTSWTFVIICVTQPVGT